MITDGTADLWRELGWRLGQRRSQQGATLAAVAARAGVSHSTVQRMETAAYTLPAATLTRIAAALGMDEHQLDHEMQDITYTQRQQTRIAAFLEANPMLRVVLSSLTPRTWTADECRAVIRAMLTIERAQRVPAANASAPADH